MWEHHLLLGLLHVCGASVPSDFLEDVKGLFKESVKDCPNGYVIISSVPLHQNDPTWTELLFDKPVELSDSGLLSTSCALIFSDGSSSIEVISSMIKDLRPFRNQVFLIWDELTPETDWDELGREANARFVVARPSQNRISLNLICPFNPLGAEKRIIWYTSTGVTGNAFQTLLEHCNGIGTTWKAFYRAIKPTVNRPEPGNSMITGLEVDITNLVTEILGNKVDYIMVNQTLMEISKGVRMSNQIFMISQYEGHLGLGLSSLNSRFHPFVDFPPTFLMTKLFYTTRLPAPLPSYQSLVRIFSPVIWGALLGANLVASVVLFRMYQYYQLEPLKTYIRTQKGSLIEFILRMNVTINKPEVLPWFRSFSGGSLLSLVFYVYTMLIGFFYTSELLTVLIRAQREAPIDSPQDILNRGARVYIPDILTLARVDSPLFEIYPKVVQAVTFLAIRTGGLYSYAENKGEMPSNSKKDVEKNGAVYIFPGLSTASSLMVESTISTQYVSKNPADQPTPITLHIPKFAPWGPKLSQLLQHVVENGFVEKFARSYTNNTLKVVKEEEIIVPLTLFHIISPFVLIVFGHTLGTITFGYELFKKPSLRAGSNQGN